MTKMIVARLLVLGDICLNGAYESVLENQNENFLLYRIESIFSEIDIAIANLECPLAYSGFPRQDKINMRAKPEYIKFLKKIKLFSLANNHIFDYGEEGFRETVEVLRRTGLSWVGAGRNLSEARQPSIFEIKGIKLGFLAYSCPTTNGLNYAGFESYGVAPLTLSYLYEDIRKLKKMVDVVVVSVHWGMEQQHYPTGTQIMVARKIINAGADAIIGHHPHVIQGIERYRKGVVCYSLGNFMFSNHSCYLRSNDNLVKYESKLEKKNRESIAIRFAIHKNENGAVLDIEKIVPIALDNNYIPHVTDKRDLTVDIDKLSSDLCSLGIIQKRRVRATNRFFVKTTYSDGALRHFYCDEPIDRYKFYIFMSRIMQKFVNKLFGFVKNLLDIKLSFKVR